MQHGDQEWDVFFKAIWVKSVPLKIQTFTWNLVQNRLPTLSNLATRGVVPMNEKTCKGCIIIVIKMHFFLSNLWDW